jgi:hypothetical protein
MRCRQQSGLVMVMIAATLICVPMAGAADTIKMGVAGAHSGDLTKSGQHNNFFRTIAPVNMSR